MQITTDIAQALLATSIAIGLLLLVELVAPQDRIALTARIRAWGFWLIAIPVNVVVVTAMSRVWHGFGIRPLIVVPVDETLSGWGWSAVIVAPLIAAMLNDFFFYWFHRAEHAFLWRFHAVHHSIRDLHGGSGYHHVSEPFFRYLLMTIPASLVTTDVNAIAVMSAILGLQQLYVHSSTSADLGWGRAIFVDNRFHRIHHSLETRHFDKNFGAMTTLWDRLFGTAYWPTKDEWPNVGLAQIDEPRSLRQYIDLPLRFRSESGRDVLPIEQ
ncbi:MAG TPA: sterol desaturase family protein [Sphingomonas sp.]